jgi:hypothetical protein
MNRDEQQEGWEYANAFDEGITTEHSDPLPKLLTLQIKMSSIKRERRELLKVLHPKSMC